MSRLLDLPHGHVTILDDEDAKRVEALTLYRGTNGYVYFSTWVNGRSMPRTLHSFLVDAPKGSHIDHIDGDKLNNTRANLRVVSPSINQVNRKRRNRNNTSGIRGVAYRPNLSASKPWHVQIGANGTTHYVGMFATMYEAIGDRRRAERDFWGEQAP